MKLSKNKIKEWSGLVQKIDSLSLNDMENLEFELLPKKDNLNKKVINIEYLGVPLAGKSTLLLENTIHLFKKDSITTVIPEFVNLLKKDRRNLFKEHKDQHIINYFISKSKMNNSLVSKKYEYAGYMSKATNKRYIINDRGGLDVYPWEVAGDLVSFGRNINRNDNVFPNYYLRSYIRNRSISMVKNVDIIVLGDVSLKYAYNRRKKREGVTDKKGSFTNKDYFLASKVAYRHWIANIYETLKSCGIGIFAFDGDKSLKYNLSRFNEYFSKIT